ncbi:LuxR C-terminal-related transcriptional regulator [Bacillus sp. KH172YL63]|uniref:LuxR C-terminal-related transcriptional regulator n=1 Tax=Bacillus sp. KH172YL63 TaxID=2709784 RepID=UPI0013E4286B|nr:LuxR C-terminal-related transcriptional regulator [Bacillus sp. KH172YL63]BCB05722.1 hypothetical protein KH172YL63_38550 [Bacillus sp. KH172YL63]
MAVKMKFLQDIQEAYAKLAELTMFIVDREGNLITDVTYREGYSKMDLSSDRARESFARVLEPLGAMKTTMLLNSESGAKYILSPIYIHDTLIYYLFAGYILETSSRSFVQQRVKKFMGNPADVLSALDATPECTEGEKLEKIELVKKCSGMLTEYLTLHDDKARTNKKLTVIQQSLELTRRDGVLSNSLMEDILSTNNQFDFIGLALESKDGNGYAVDFIEGERTDRLRGHTFLLGEGFLGHTVAIEQFQHWKNAGMDPRIHFFASIGMDIKSLFCIPIYGDHNVKGVYFGGTYHQELTEQDTREHAYLKSAIISILITTKTLRADLQNHLMELSTFNETFKVITSVEDIKRVLYILVDISLNVVRGPFSCIVLMPDQKHSNVEIVSRGLSTDQINEYGMDVIRRMSAQRTETIDPANPTVHQTEWGTKVLEFPLIFNDDLQGILCVGCYPGNPPENYQSFLSSLAVAGSISMHLHRNKTTSLPSGQMMEVLTNILATVGPEKYERSLRVRDIVESFTKRFYQHDADVLVQASLLVEYDEMVIDELMKDSSVKRVLKEFHQWNDKGKDIFIQGEILVICHYFVQQGEDIKAIEDFKTFSPLLREQFIDYVHHQHIIESEISIASVKESGSMEVDRIDINGLKDMTQLSNREIDVLNLVLKGCSNLEIASELYISDHTVKNHMTKILQKLGVADRSQAIAKVYKLGYFPIES